MREKFVRINMSRWSAYNLKHALILLNNYCITCHPASLRPRWHTHKTGQARVLKHVQLYQYVSI